jgi:hypothetical protein
VRQPTYRTAFLLAVAALVLLGCSSSTSPQALSSRAYQGHEGDADMSTFAATHPSTIGTRLDDCQTCHQGGTVDYGDGQETLNPCLYCHLITYPDTDIVSGAPVTYGDTLNPFGRDYRDNGRDSASLVAIADVDSDGDGYGNDAEIGDGRYPGDADSTPGQPVAPIRTFTWFELQTGPAHEQLMLLNSHRQQFDFYAEYEGIRVKDLLDVAGVDLTNATGITVIAPDGYAQDFTLAEVDAAFPAGLWYPNLSPGDFADPNQGFVTYPPASILPAGLVDGGPIPGEPWLLLAWHRDGLPMDVSSLDPVSGKIQGEGPYRVVVPQAQPGSPDRGSRYSPSGYADGWDYDDTKDHNAGRCVRGVVAIRVNPMPPGLEEFDWKNGGWSLVADKKLILYGQGVVGD